MMKPRAAGVCPAKADPDAEFADDWEIIRNDIDPAQFDKLKQLRELVRWTDDHPASRERPRCANPYVLLRQLRSCALDPERAARFFGVHYLGWITRIDLETNLKAWRTEMARLKTRRSQVVRDYCAISEGCPDKHGVPILLLRFGVLDTTGLMREVGRHAILMHCIDYMERASEHLTQACRRLRRVVPGQIWLADGGNNPYVPYLASRMTFGAYAIGDVLKGMKCPVTMRKVIIIRPGFVVQNLWRGVILPLLTRLCSKTALSNVHVCGNSASSWRALLGGEVDEKGPETPAFLFSDSAVAVAAATPAGGLIPASTGAEVAADSAGEVDSSEDEGTATTAEPSITGTSVSGSSRCAPNSGASLRFDVASETSVASLLQGGEVRPFVARPGTGVRAKGTRVARVSSGASGTAQSGDGGGPSSVGGGSLVVAEDTEPELDLKVEPARRSLTGCSCDSVCAWR